MRSELLDGMVSKNRTHIIYIEFAWRVNNSGTIHKCKKEAAKLVFNHFFRPKIIHHLMNSIITYLRLNI